MVTKLRLSLSCCGNSEDRSFVSLCITELKYFTHVFNASPPDCFAEKHVFFLLHYNDVRALV